MMDRRLKEYLRQMSVGSQDAIDFVGTMSFAEFQTDTKTQRAVAMSLVIVGEAATKTAERSPEFIQAHTEIAWSNIRGMRNRIAHDYFVINFEVIWQTLELELPELPRCVAALHDEEA